MSSALPESSPVTRNERGLLILTSALIVVLVFLAYWPVVNAGFINLDDEQYVAANRLVQQGLTGRGLRWAFVTGTLANWHPLTWLAHMTDCQLFGIDPRGPHLMNVALHALDSVLLLILLLRMTGSVGASAMVAVLFALHPAHVESVAWISERKDVLSTLFWLLTTFAYLGAVRERRARWWLAVGVFFSLGLLTKPMLVTLPFTLLLLDFWPLERAKWVDAKSWRVLFPLIREKRWLFFLSLLSSVATFIAQRRGGAMASLETLPLFSRLGSVLVGYARYLGLLVWPTDLAILYPQRASWPLWQALGSLVLLVLLTAFAVRQARRRPWVLFGWLFFLGTLVPVIGIVQVGSQSIADRYSYVPSIGLFIAFAWSLYEAATNRPLRMAALNGILITLMLVLARATKAQAAMWKDSETVFRRALAVTTDNWLAHERLGETLMRQGRDREAFEHIDAALRLQPTYARAVGEKAVLLTRSGRTSEALAVFRESLRLDPSIAETHGNLGALLARTGRLDEAAAELAEALRLDPDDPKTHHNLGNVQLARRDFPGAVAHFRDALALDPNDANAHLKLGVALGSLGQLDDAVPHLRRAVTLDGNSIDAHANLAMALGSRGEVDEALTHVAALEQLAEAHAKKGAWREAIAIAGRAEHAARDLGRSDLQSEIAARRERYQRAAVEVGSSGGARP